MSEEHSKVPLLDVVAGRIPEDIDGVLLRNGPNPVPEHGYAKRHHWFDGHGMFHSIAFADRKAEYSNSYIGTELFRFEQQVCPLFFPLLDIISGVKIKGGV